MSQIIRLEALTNCVVSLRQKISVDKETVGTGIFIGKEDKLLLITAEHVAKEINKDGYLILNGPGNIPIKVDINKICNLTSDNDIPWIFHDVADVAMLKLEVSDLEKNTLFKNRFLPIDNVFSGKEIISRDLELTTIGFPMGLGAIGRFSPLTFRSYISSGLITLKRSDNEKNCDFFILENPGMGGYSGGPIFDLSVYCHGAMTSTGNGTFLRGIMHGTISDKTGGKLAAVTPSFYIKELIDKI
ncbi:MAG: trypsin-like peptidase domain-containing protein [Candidatus Pacebacteria bacterium]|nr:trypsin-like peptidase domain-containing protein [Candidatus Paceibacterota bacterium]